MLAGHFIIRSDNPLTDGQSIDHPGRRMEIPRNLGENVRKLRETRGLSQQQLAKLSGIPRPTWANIESGSANPTLSVLTRVASTLQVSIEELISAPRASLRQYRASELPARVR